MLVILICCTTFSGFSSSAPFLDANPDLETNTLRIPRRFDSASFTEREATLVSFHFIFLDSLRMRAVVQPATLPKTRPKQAAKLSVTPIEPPKLLVEHSFSWRNVMKRSSSLFYSAFLHAALLILLALIAVQDRGEKKSSLLVNSGNTEETVENLTFEMFEPRVSTPSTESQSIESASLSQVTSESSTSIESQTASEALVSSTLGASLKLPKLDSYQSMVTAFAPKMPMFAKSSLDGRSLENRNKLVLSRGGSAKSEKAVEAALVWFAKHQHRDGGWSTYFNEPTSPCNGLCTHGSIEHLDAKRPAATGLALLCFLGAGYTHQEGKYKDEVYRGLMFLMDNMKHGKQDNIDPRWPGQFSSSLSKHQMYEQGIATLALCEAYQMTHDKMLMNSCQEAIDFITAAQHYDGSWGYFPKTPGDLSIVGWQMMSLKSAHGSELQVNSPSIRWVDRFLDTQQSDGGAKYGYRGTRPTPSMTSIGILMRLYRGNPRTDPRLIRGAAYIAENGPSRFDVYLNYYATQALFQMESAYWPKWNAKLREYLIQTQNQLGHEMGSWYFEDDSPPPSNAIGGRLYCTALATMTLEVYYRYLPVYLDVNEQPFEY